MEKYSIEKAQEEAGKIKTRAAVMHPWSHARSKEDYKEAEKSIEEDETRKMEKEAKEKEMKANSFPLVINHWVPEKGFGFAEYKGKKIFIHKTAIDQSYRYPKDTNFNGQKIIVTETEESERGFKVKSAFTEKGWEHEKRKDILESFEGQKIEDFIRRHVVGRWDDVNEVLSALATPGNKKLEKEIGYGVNTGGLGIFDQKIETRITKWEIEISGSENNDQVIVKLFVDGKLSCNGDASSNNGVWELSRSAAKVWLDESIYQNSLPPEPPLRNMRRRNYAG